MCACMCVCVCVYVASAPTRRKRVVEKRGRGWRGQIIATAEQWGIRGHFRLRPGTNNVRRAYRRTNERKIVN